MRGLIIWSLWQLTACAGTTHASSENPPSTVVAVPEPAPSSPAPGAEKDESPQRPSEPAASAELTVRPDDQMALGAAAKPFATYLNQIHNRLHKVFADQFLVSLDALPANDPMSAPSLVTTLELVLGGTDGRLVRVAVVRTSGVNAFDLGALDSVSKAAPFGKPPDPIVSANGNVHIHWEFHRDPFTSCSTRNTRPFILK